MKKVSSRISLLLILLAIPLIIYSALHSQDSRQRASGTTLDTTKIGIAAGDVLPHLNDYDLEAYFNDIKSLGVTWIRFNFDWSQIQAAGRGQFDWSRYDKIVTAANTRGIKVLGVLTYTPTWALAYGCTDSYKCSPANPTDFATFATAAATRFGPIGVHTWEIWNEPNGGTMTPSAYTMLLKGAYPAIKNADSYAFVLAGGSMPIGTSGNTFSPTDFLEGIYANGGKNYFDAVTHHPYCWGTGSSYDCPNATVQWSAWSQMKDTQPSLRTIMASNGDESKPLWGTEFGAPTAGGTAAATETQQAKMLVNGYKLWNTYIWSGPLFWYQYKDKCTDPNDTECFFGLVRPDGTHKPAYEAFRDLATLALLPSYAAPSYAGPTAYVPTITLEPTEEPNPYVTPIFNCLGPCPTLPPDDPYAPTATPVYPTLTPTETPPVYPSVEPTAYDTPTDSPAYPSEYPTEYPTAYVTQDPCTTYTTSLAHDNKSKYKSKHKKHSGYVSRGSGYFLDFLIQLLNRIFALFGGGQIPYPPPAVTPYPTVYENPTEVPTAAPTDYPSQYYPTATPAYTPCVTPSPYYAPTEYPTVYPTEYPTAYPTKYIYPTKKPYKKPTPTPKKRYRSGY